MRVPLEWLAEFVDGLPDADELARRLTMAGLEIEAVHRPDPALVANLVVARIVTKERHPSADRLSLCRVDDGAGTRNIVCGATNMQAGDRVVLARPGAMLPGGVTIKKARIRGQESEGMLCSAAELGLPDEQAGIMILGGDVAPGEPAAQLLGLADTVLEVAVTPNRGDCLSIRGLAREVAAVCGLELRDAFRRQAAAPAGTSRFTVRVEAPADCPLYCGLEVRGVRVGPSPAWLRARLAAAGLRSINNVVDVTNYLLIDRGQPLHAFDAGRLEGETISVRNAAAGDELETLDGQMRRLETGDLVIADAKGAVALAGVMGGARSAVQQGTTSLFLESAMFRSGRVRATSRRLGLISESSYRFERGVDPAGVEPTLLEAARMVVEIGGGEVVGGVARGGPGHQPVPPVRIRAERVETILGIRIGEADIERIVRALGGGLTREGDGFVVCAPTHRHDLAREIDWIEEIARLTGYDAIPPAVPVMAAMEASVPRSHTFAAQVRERMAARGLTEIVGLAFSDEHRNRALPGLHASGGTSRLRNPLRSDATEMRRSVLPGLLDAHALNVRSGARTTDLFIIGRTFAGDGAPERQVIGGLLWGPRRARRPGDAGPVEFGDVKAAIEAAAAITGAHDAITWKPDASRPEYHPRECAALVLSGQVIGYAGRIHPELVDTLAVARDAYVFEVDSMGLATYAPPRRATRSVPRFPASRRDVSLLVPESLLAGEVVAAILGSKEPLVEEAWVFDQYEGEGIAAGERALGVAIVYRAGDRTLTDAEVVATHDKVVAALCKGLPVRPRL